MTFTQYQLALMSFTPASIPWEYSPIACENELCCAAETLEGKPMKIEVHGSIEFSNHRQAIIICEDCHHQIKNKLYERETLIK